MKWTKPGTSNKSQSDCSINSFDELILSVCEDIQHSIPIPKNDLIQIQNLDFGDLIDLNKILYIKNTKNYLIHSISKEIKYRIIKLKSEVASSLIIQLDPFNYESLKKNHKIYQRNIKMLQNDFLLIQSGSYVSTNYGEYNLHLKELFSAKINVYESVLNKIDFYLKFNGFNPDNPNKQYWSKNKKKYPIKKQVKQSLKGDSISDTPEILLEKDNYNKSSDPITNIESVTINNSKKEEKITKNEYKIKTAFEPTVLISLFKIIFNYEELKKYLPNPVLFDAKSLYINPEHIEDLVYRLFDYGITKYDEAPDLSYLDFKIDNGYLCVWSTFLRDLIELDSMDHSRLLGKHLIFLSSDRNQGNQKFSVHTYKKHFSDTGNRNSLELNNTRIPIKSILEKINLK